MSYRKTALLATLLLTTSTLVSQQNSPHTKNKVLNKDEALRLSSLSSTQSGTSPSLLTSGKIQTFTGKTVGSHVRLRTQPTTDSIVVRELTKGELIVADSEENGYYAVLPPKNTKAYIFRSFVLEGVVEGNRVNIRMEPKLDAAIIGSLSSGDKVEGTICPNNPKWLEIDPPQSVRYYVAKEFIDYVGTADLKSLYDTRLATASKLMDEATNVAKVEMTKPFEEIDFSLIEDKFNLITSDYREFPEISDRASSALSSLQEEYLKTKLSYLEGRASTLTKAIESNTVPLQSSSIAQSLIPAEDTHSQTETMKSWDHVERALYQTWAAAHRAATIDKFYEEQEQEATQITGVVEAFKDPILSKPGDYLIRQNGVPVAYLYSTAINLDAYLGKMVSVKAAPRPNNSFAHKAYFALSVE